MMRIIILFVVLGLAGHLAYAEEILPSWRSIVTVDDFTDKRLQYTVFENQEYRIQINKEESVKKIWPVWMFITIKGIGSFHPDGVIEFRVDKWPTRKDDPVTARKLERYMQEKIFQWQPKTVAMVVWHGDEEEGCGFIEELTTGKYLMVRYQTEKMSRTHFKISLSGARDALIRSLNLKICI